MRVTLIPAAGSSSRMRGGDKLLELIDNQPILAVLAQRAREAAAQVFVTLPNKAHPRCSALNDLEIGCIFVQDAHNGMSQSLRAGVAALPNGISGLMILPADMPEITAQDMRDAWELFEREQPIALRCTAQSGAQGHPTIFSPQLLPEFETLEGDRGANSILQAQGSKVLLFALPDDHARLDLDTPEDWAAWRASL